MGGTPASLSTAIVGLTESSGSSLRSAPGVGETPSAPRDDASAASSAAFSPAHAVLLAGAEARLVGQGLERARVEFAVVGVRRLAAGECDGECERSNSSSVGAASSPSLSL